MPTRTTLTLDEDVRANLEAEMRKTGKSFKETVSEMLRAGLILRQNACASEAFKVEARDLGLKPGYSYDDVWGLIEEAEGPDHR